MNISEPLIPQIPGLICFKKILHSYQSQTHMVTVLVLLIVGRLTVSGESAIPTATAMFRITVLQPHSSRQPQYNGQFHLSKLIRSSSITSGRLITLVFILMMYSPSRPVKNICAPPRKNTPITTGAFPATNWSQ